MSAGGFTEDREPDVTPQGKKRAHQAGYLCSEQNGSIKDCPHPNSGKKHRVLRDEWLAGFGAHQKKLALAMSPAAKKKAAKAAKTNGAEKAE